MDAEHYRQLVAGSSRARRGGRAPPPSASSRSCSRADAATGAAVPVERVRAAVAGASYAPYRRVRARRPGRAEPALRAGVATLAAAAARATSPRCAPTASRAGIRLDATPGRRPAPSRGAAAAGLAAVRRDAAPLRHDRPGGSADDAPDRVDPGLPGLVAGRRRAEQWRVLHLAGPFLAAAFARRTGSASRLATWLAVDPAAHRVRRPAAARATTRWRRTPTSPRRATPFAGAGERAPDDALPAGPAARPLPRGALPRRAARGRGVAGSSAVLAALVYDDGVRGEALRLAGRRGAPAGAALGRRGAGGRGRRRPRPRARRADPAPSWAVRHEGVLFVTDPLAGLAAPTSTRASG